MTEEYPTEADLAVLVKLGLSTPTQAKPDKEKEE